MENHIAIANAVQYLYGKGIIKKDKDIADKTGYNKSTVSSFITGHTKASLPFIQKFEKAFRLSLKDFVKGGTHEPVPIADPTQMNTEKLLQVYAIGRTNQSLLVEVLAHLKNIPVMEVQRTVTSAMADELKGLKDELQQKNLS